MSESKLRELVVNIYTHSSLKRLIVHFPARAGGDCFFLPVEGEAALSCHLAGVIERLVAVTYSSGP